MSETQELSFGAPSEEMRAKHGSFAPKEQLPHVAIVNHGGEAAFMDALTFAKMAADVLALMAGSRPPAGSLHTLLVEIGEKHENGYTIGYSSRPYPINQESNDEQ